MSQRVRVQCYIDGFNLYHAISNIGQPHLKWLDLNGLMTRFIDPAQHEITSILYFSAFATWMPGAFARHQQYVKALKATGVTPVMGHFKQKDRSCRSCGATWIGHEEKETDVNIALHLLNDAHKDRYDEAFIVSRDSDLTPAVKMVLEQFPTKKIKMISPPNAGHSKEIAKLVGKKKLASVKLLHLERCMLPQVVVDPDTKAIVAKRPVEYDPPVPQSP